MDTRQSVSSRSTIQLVLALLLIAALGTSCTKNKQKIMNSNGIVFTGENRPTASLTPNETAGLMSNGFALLVDIREPSEPITSRAKDAVSMPLSAIKGETDAYKTWAAQVGTDKQLVFYGESEAPAHEASDLMKTRGFNTGYIQAYQAWLQLKLPTTPEPAKP